MYVKYINFESITTLANKDSKEKGKWNRAYVNTTFYDLDNNNNKNLSSALMAAMFINPDLLNECKRKYDILYTKLMNDGIDPLKITMARLTIDGLWFSEIFGISPLNEGLKTQVFDELIKTVQEE